MNGVTKYVIAKFMVLGYGFRVNKVKHDDLKNGDALTSLAFTRNNKFKDISLEL